MTRSSITDTGGHSAWPPDNAPARRSTDRLIAWGLFVLALMGWSLVGLVLLVPEIVTWRHIAFAVIFSVKSFALTIISVRLLRLVIRGKGRRRA